MKFWIFFRKHPKLFCLYLSNQISLRGCFVFKTISRISSITSYKDHCYSFFTGWVIKQQKSCILNILEKTPNFGRTVRTLDNTFNLKIQFSEAYTQRSIGICKKNREKNIFVQFLGCVSKQNFSIFQVLGTVYFAVCHIFHKEGYKW